MDDTYTAAVPHSVRGRHRVNGSSGNSSSSYSKRSSRNASTSPREVDASINLLSPQSLLSSSSSSSSSSSKSFHVLSSSPSSSTSNPLSPLAPSRTASSSTSSTSSAMSFGRVSSYEREVSGDGDVVGVSKPLHQVNSNNNISASATPTPIVLDDIFRFTDMPTHSKLPTFNQKSSQVFLRWQMPNALYERVSE